MSLLGFYAKMAQESALVFLVFSGLMFTVEGREYCAATPRPNDNYYCDVGHCCGDGECCTYYYELWWFWLVWFLIVFVVGFCVWQRKRFHPWREHQAYRNHCGLCGPPDLYPDILAIPPVKLPSYAEIGETASFNTPPPPYTCECYMPAVRSPMGSFDQPPPEFGAPPRYVQYAHMVTPLLSRMHSSTSSTGTQFPEGETPEQSPIGPLVHPPAPEPTVQPPQQQSSTPCLSCSSPSTPLTASRSCSCSSTQSPSRQTVNTRGIPGHAFRVGLGTDLYFQPTWYSSFGKGDNTNRVPFIRGANYNPCPRCVSRSSASLGHDGDSAIMRDASTSTLNQTQPSLNQEPQPYERRNSYSLPRNFVCSVKRTT